MKKKILLISISLILVLSFVLSSCKPAVAPETVAETAAETVAETAAETEAVTAGEWGNIDWKQFAGTELHVLMLSMPISEVYKKHISEFEELTGMKVTMELLNTEDERKKRLTDFAAGTGQYDLASVAISYREEYAQPGYIEPLTPYLDNPKLTDKEWYNIDDYPADVIKAGYTKSGDFVYIPYTAEYYLIWYLKDVFDQLGLKAPQTWDEYEQVVQALDDARKAGEVSSYAHFDRTLVGSGEAGWSMFCSASRYGLDIVDFDTKTVNINSPLGIEFMTWYTDWALKYGPEGSLNWGWSDLAPAFGQGLLSMTIGGNASYTTIENPEKSSVAGKVGYAHPVMKNDGKDPLFEWGWGINSASKNKEATWLLIEWMTSPTLIKAIAPEYGCPARLSVYSDPAYINAMPSQEFIDNQTWMMKNGVDPSPQLIDPGFAETSQIVSQEMSNVLAGIKDAKKACADIEAQLVALGYKAYQQ